MPIAILMVFVPKLLGSAMLCEGVVAITKRYVIANKINLP